MSVSYEWNFAALDVELGPDAESPTDIVMTVHWQYSATDGEDPPHTASYNGTSPVKWEEGEPWISYHSLTESDVQGWVEEQVGEERIEQLESSLAANIAEQVTPTHETFRTMPWDEDNGA